jgi:hypothetical protein
MINVLVQYVPLVQKSVVGVVLGRREEPWKVDIGSALGAPLDDLVFDGATKRNTPQLRVSCVRRHYGLQYLEGLQGHGTRVGALRRASSQS